MPVSSKASIPNAQSERVIRLAHERGDIIMGDDGFFIYWPDRPNGALSEWLLRAIADELERLNAPWAAEMNRYFAQAGEAGTAATVKQGAVHEHAVRKADAPK